MKKHTKHITLSTLFLGVVSIATAGMASPQQINRETRVASDREVVMTQGEVSNTAMSTPRGPSYINRHARLNSQRSDLISDKSETSKKISDVAMSEPTAAQQNRHN